LSRLAGADHSPCLRACSSCPERASGRFPSLSVRRRQLREMRLNRLLGRAGATDL
jgi:hypothetical protein